MRAIARFFSTLSDPRWYQLVVLSLLLSFGIGVLDFGIRWQNAVAIFAAPLPRPKQILVTTERKENEIWVLVEDSGPGLTTGNGADIFAAFTTTNTNGMGMGLTICRRIIEGHGGSILAGAGKLGGSCFRFSLPIATEKENHGAE